ncbi:hypothetical protein [Hansschlegelia plantiphila]|uniref:Uncharacterized protein n=1 Tax=Hansschlegelia plantiphila TaxID=374655 RepID=A0A9W6J0G6_9HYPH|nr:hypothetical protein [Hansschlegelia plantiphila]GLK67458.1 hypothetical protein GCM10008179_10960 [Hansschlegelia plantiphila]
MGTLTRRALLGSVGAVALGGLAYGGSRIGCTFVPRNHPDFFSLLDVVPDDAVARRIGRNALTLASISDNLPALSASLTEQPLIRQAIEESCPTARMNLVQDQCALDFAEMKTVVVDGWVLSETEASLCAARVLGSASA